MRSTDPLSSLNTDEPDMGLRTRTQSATTRRAAWLLSLFGFIPFAIGALALLFIAADNPQRVMLVAGMKTYGAIILSFLGGIRWGVSLKSIHEDETLLILIGSVTPSLLGWFSLLLPLPYVFAFQALVFAGQGAWDSISGQQGILPWFVKLRMILTFLVTGALIVAFFATV